jgi:hypothetical protein
MYVRVPVGFIRSYCYCMNLLTYFTKMKVGLLFLCTVKVYTRYLW